MLIMKRISLLILTALILGSSALTAMAQERKEDFTPKRGDFGISVMASPLTELTNAFKGTAYTPMQPTVTISGKYMVTDHGALFLNLGWLYRNSNDTYYTRDDAAYAVDPFTMDKVTDAVRANTSGGNFSFGFEGRVGMGRAQGVFGIGAMYAFSYYDSRYTYGNAITAVNQVPSTAFNGINGTSVPGVSYQRYLRQFSGAPTHTAGLLAYAGIEWFVAPKVSLGARVNLIAAYSWTNATYYVAEGYNTMTAQVEEWTELLSPSSGAIDFGTENIGADLSINVYF